MDPATLRPELRDALKSLASGKISGIIRLPSGYAILKLLPEGMSPAPANSNPNRILPLAATGSIRYPPSVGGKGEADLAFRYFPKPENWSQDLHALCSIRKQSLSSATEQLQKDTSLMSSDAALQGGPLDQIERHYALANLYAYQGIMDKSVAEWETAYQIGRPSCPVQCPNWRRYSGLPICTNPRWTTTFIGSRRTVASFRRAKPRAIKRRATPKKRLSIYLKYLERKPGCVDINGF